MKKLLAVLAISGGGLYAVGVCTGPGVVGGNEIEAYNNVSLTSSTVLPADTADSCTIGGLTFSNFQVAGGAGANFSSDFSFDALFNGNQIQLQYTNLGTADIEIYYTVTGGMTGMVLSVGTATSVTEVVCATAFAAPNSTCNPGPPLNQTIPFTVQASGPTTELSYITPAATEYVVKDVAGGSEITQTVIPEPMTFSLMGAGLLGLGLLGRKIRK